MKIEYFENALYKALREYWQSQTEIWANGKYKIIVNKGYSHPKFERENIEKLKEYFFDNNEPKPTLIGRIENAYYEMDANSSTNINLHIYVSAEEYNIGCNDNEEISVIFLNVTFGTE